MPDTSHSPSPMPLSTTPDENRQDRERKGLMLPPPIPSKDGQSTPVAPPRMTRLPSLKELSNHLHYTPSSTPSAQLPNPLALATPDRGGRQSVPSTPPSLRISTNPATLAQGTPNGVGASPLVAPSPSSRLKLPASAMMRSLSSGPGSSGPSLTGLTSASPVDRRSSLAMGGSESGRSPGWSSREFTGSKDIFATAKHDASCSSSPTTNTANAGASAEASTSMSRVGSVDYIQGYKDVPSLDQLRRRVSISRAMSFSSSASGPERKEKEKAQPEEKRGDTVKQVETASPQDTASQDSASSDEGTIVRKKEHSLQHAWTLYFDSKSYKPDPSINSGKDASLLADYEKTLVSVGKFDTVEGFARHLNNVRLPSGLAKNSNYHMFKNGIRPMWEDPANANGGKWVILFRSSPPTLDVAWANLTMALVGEVLDPEDQVCGIVASNRPKIDRIQIWTRGREDVEKLNALGRRIVDVMALEGRDADAMSMEFQYNASNAHPPAGKFIHIPFPTSRSTPSSTPQPNRGIGGFHAPPGMSLSISPLPLIRGPNSPSFPPPKSPTHLGIPLPDATTTSFRGRLGSGSGSNAFSGPMGGMAMGRFGSSNSIGSGSPLKKDGNLTPAHTPGVIAGGGA